MKDALARMKVSDFQVKSHFISKSSIARSEDRLLSPESKDDILMDCHVKNVMNFL